MTKTTQPAAEILCLTTGGRVEPLRPVDSPLDVLCQQLIGMASGEEWSGDDAFALLRRSAPFAALDRTDFDACLDRSLNQRLKVLGKDGRTRITTPMTVGSDLIAMRYAKGDHHAQRIVAGRSGQRRPMSPRRVDQSDTQEPLPLE